MRTGLFPILAGLLPCMLAATAQGQESPRIPLCTGLTLVGAVSEPHGDYESIVRIVSVTADSVSVTLSTDQHERGNIRHIKVNRVISQKDLSDATLLVNWFTADAATAIPGSTAFGVSTSVLRSLKSTGEAQLALVDRGSSAMPADRTIHPNIYDYQTAYRLRRIGSTPVKFSTTVNGSQVDLPAIQARGENMGDTAEFNFLDDESNPIGLSFRFTPFGSASPQTESRVVKIAYRCPDDAARSPASVAGLERALVETGRVDVYDIYFDFNSDRIREESEPTLDEIAEIMRRHPDWKLEIAGHTDSIGSDADNLDLSKRRAASVKNALVNGRGIGGNRLATSGYGEALPRDRNDTLEGRARNRRVELVRTVPAR